MFITNDPLHIPTRQLRAQLSAHLKTQTAFSIGTPYTLRAIVVPIPQFNPWDDKARRHQLQSAKKAFLTRWNQLKTLTQ